MEMNYNDAELHEIEQELNIDIVPGTELMADVGSHHFVKSKAGVLVPQPSDDPHDPLNWSPKWKAAAIITATWVSFVQGMGPLALAPTFPLYMKEFDRDLADVVKFTGNAILVLGFSNFIWVPISSAFGRRPVYIFSNLICLASMIWRARAQSYGSFMAASIVNGIGAGPAESIQPAVIADIFFLHDRGFWNTLYWTFYMGSLMVGPIISGSMSAHYGWRPFWWLNVAMISLAIVMTIFLFPETKWHRQHPNEVVAGIARQEQEKNEEASAKGNIVEKTETNGTMPDLSKTATAARDPFLGKGAPSKRQFGIYAPSEDPLRSILRELITPWRLLLVPIIIFASFVVSWSCSSFLVLNLTQSQNFAAPPYNFSTVKVGYTNFAIFIGILLGLATAGPFSDWVSKRLTIRNRGVREPEMRLVAMIPYVIIMYLGNIIVSVGYQNKWPWPVIVILGYTMTGIQTSALPAMASTYAVDSYKPVAGPLFVAITVNKNVWGYGVAEFLTPWIIKDGFIKPIMTNATLILFFCLCAIPFYFYGKTFRRWTRNSFIHKEK